jgi:WD40 repeat protein/serine/threonine protein kinase
MSDATPSRPSADRNLLFGILALQMDFISRDALIAAMHAWVLDKAKSLGQILVEQGGLDPARRELLEPLVAAHLEIHEGDPEKSLAAIGVPVPVRRVLQSLGDGDVDASLARMPTPTRDATVLRATTAEKPGVLGLRYQVLRPHGKGGIGEVFVALDQELNREIALKEIRHEHADDLLSRGRFVREAEITGGLEHPGIVPVYGLGQYADGRPFYAMRFIQGETLKDAIARYHQASPVASAPGELGALKQPRSLGFELRGLLARFVAVCNTIAYAHSRGVIHRDIKPANIMLGKYGETLIVDWGLAKARADSPARSASDSLSEPALVPRLAEIGETQAGAALGTPSYMSPEQAAGRLDLLGPASDIYSLGATLYCLLTGRPPIEGKDTAEILRKAQRGEWLLPRRVQPNIPPALDAISCKAMALIPDKRYGTALELAADVEHWLGEEAVLAWSEPWTVRARRWLRRHRVLSTSVVAGLAVALIASIAGLLLLAAANERERQAKQNQAAARVIAEDKEKEARQNLYVAQLNLVQREFEANHFARVRELLDQQVPAQPEMIDIRGFEWYYWYRLTHQELLRTKVDTGFKQVDFTPDGKRFATGSEDRTVEVWDSDTGQKLLTLKHDFPVSIAFSPDGKRIGGYGAGTFRIWNTITGEETFALTGVRMSSPFSYCANGRWIVAGVHDNSIKLWDSATGEELLAIQAPRAQGDLVFSKSGERIAMGTDENTLTFWDGCTVKELFAVPAHFSFPLQSYSNLQAFSPDGKRFTMKRRYGTLQVLDSTTGQELLAIDANANAGPAICSPDGKTLAFTALDNTLRVWDSTTGRELYALQGYTGAITSMAFSPDGKRIATLSRDETLRLWDSDTGRELFTLRGRSSELENSIGSLVFSPDGKRLASRGLDMSQTTGARVPATIVKLWSTADGQEHLILQGHTNRLTSLAFSSVDKRLASGGDDGTVKVWDGRTGQELLTLPHAQPVGSVAFSSNGKFLASGGRNGTVKIWDSSTGHLLQTLLGHQAKVTSLAFSPNGEWLASGAEDVRVWATNSGRNLHNFTGHKNGVSVAFNQDGKLLTVGGGGLVIYDVESGQDLLVNPYNTGPFAQVTLSPDADRFIAAGSTNWLTIYDSRRGRALVTLTGHTAGVSDAAFSPDGKRIASGSGDKTVKVWDSISGQELLTLKGHTKGITSVAFSPDGTQLASGSADGTIIVWEAWLVPPAVVRWRELVNDVQSLFAELHLKADVLARVRTDATLDRSEREFAVNVAQTHSEESPDRLRSLAWSQVRESSLPREAYARALRLVEAAESVAPGQAFHPPALGVAQYRLGWHAKALATLAKSQTVNATKRGSHPADLAFLAMAQYQLHQKEEAKATLARLREVMKQPPWAKDAEAQGFLREAEETLKRQPASEKK